MNSNQSNKATSHQELTLEDLLQSESAVLRRINEDFQRDGDLTMASHNSTTTGHNSSGIHTSHTSAMKENLLK